MPTHASSHRTSGTPKGPSQRASRRDAGGVLMRLFGIAVTLCVLLVSFESTAWAAPIGMCADTAQSVEAPPPMFPAEDTAINLPDELTARGCKLDESDHFAVSYPTGPGERIAPSAEMPDHKVVLGDLVPVLAAPSALTTVNKDLLLLPEEHRWRGLRPPRS